jgi:predicted Zn-dependent protease
MAKMLVNPGDQKLFDDVAGSVRLLPDEPGSPEEANKSGSDALFQGAKSSLFDGTMAYLDKDFATAAQQLQKALDAEKQKRTLSRDDFRLLVDNLAVSYRFTQNQAKSKETLDYGLTQDPRYPLFHYDMACYYGLERDMSKALDELRLTYKNKSELSLSDQLADPLQEGCFGKFLKNKDFVKSVEEMKNQ